MCRAPGCDGREDVDSLGAGEVEDVARYVVE
jgi:hypothetical protein